MDPHSFTLILQSHIAGTSSSTCVGYEGAPLTQPTRLLLLGDAGAAANVDRLRSTLEQAFAPLSPAGTTGCDGPGRFRCWATDTRAARNVLLVIAGNSSPGPHLRKMVKGWVSRGFEVFGFFESGLNPRVVLPSPMHGQLGVTWQNDVREVAAEIMDIAVLGLEDRRIFISYARQDGSATADLLADALTDLRFDVFLDRFQIPPGADLLERISDELIDKAMVVVVETPAAVASPWVRYEISTARTRRLGLAAVNPGGVPPIRAIDDRARCRTIVEGPLKDFLLEQHRNQMSAKRQNLMQSVWRSLSLHVGRANVHPLADGFRVQAASQEYAIAVHTRPADLHRFRLAHQRAGTAAPVIIHPQPQRSDRKRDLLWLSQTSGVSEVDEGLIRQAAREIAAGRL